MSPRSPRMTSRQSPMSKSRTNEPVQSLLASNKKKDSISQTFLTLNGQNLHSLPPQAKAAAVIALNLEDNQFTIQSTNEFPKNLTSLSLRNNPLRSCKLPRFERLRSLLLDGCGLTSFEGLPSFPNLRLLSVSNNKISNLKDLPIFSHLESFNISNNDFEFDVVTCIAAIGSISINKFNGTEITAQNLKDAFMLSPLVGYSLRKGRNPQRFQSNEEEVSEAQKFLSEPLLKYIETTNANQNDVKLSIEEAKDGTTSIVLPLVAENIKWYRDIMPDAQGREWSPLTSFTDKDMLNVLPLANIMKMHIIKCEFTINKKQYSLYTDQPIGREEGDLCLPFPLDPILAGTPIEGSLISLIPLPIPTRVAWVSGSRLVLENSPSIILTNNEVGKPITCLLAPYCPNYEEIIFSVLNTETEPVGPLIPTVTGIKFPDNIIEGEEILFDRKMIPDREGDSTIYVDRACTPSSQWETVATLEAGDLHYTPTAQDVGSFLRVSYTPATQEGTSGDTVYFYAKTKVVPTLPRFENPMICGMQRAGSAVVAVGQYIGGKKGNCEYVWYMSDKEIHPDAKTLRDLTPVCDQQVFEIPDDAVDMYLAVELIPMRDDEVIGESAFAASTEPIVAPLGEKKEKIEYDQEIVAGKKITLEQQVQFFVTKLGAEDGFEATTFGSSFTPKQANIGQYVKVENGEFEGMLGEVQPSPSYIKEINLSYDGISIGKTLSLSIKTRNMKPNDIEVIWARVNGAIERAAAYNTNQYTITEKDIGFQIKARVTPFDKNGTRLAYMETDLTPVVKPSSQLAPLICGTFAEGCEVFIDCEQEVTDVKWQHNIKGGWKEIGAGPTYLLKKSDIGRNIRATCNINGKSITTTAQHAIDPALPKATITLPENPPEENVMYAIDVNYTGGVEGDVLSIWERNNDVKDEEEEEAWTEIAKNTKEYTPKKEDIGHVIRITYIPQRKDGVVGEEIVLTTQEVVAAKPIMKNIKLIQNKQGFLEIQGKYSGGEEGQSHVVWHAILQDGTDATLARNSEKIISPHPDIFGAEVYAEFTPERSDGVKGDMVRTNKVKVEPRPVITSAEITAKGGFVKPGNLLRVKFTINKPVSKMTYQWYRVMEEEYTPIENATNVEYTPVDDDGDYFIGCSIVAIARNGWASDPFMTVTSVAVDVPKARITLLDENSMEFKDKIVTGTQIYPIVKIANVETDDYHIIWQRNSKESKKKWIDITDEKMFCPTVNQVGYKIRAVVDGEASEEYEIVLPHNSTSFMKAVIRSKSFKFTCTPRAGSSVWSVTLKSSGLTMKSKNGIEKSAKWATVNAEAIEGTKDEMKLTIDASSSFIFYPTLDDARIESNIGKENARDFIVAIIRSFAHQ